MTSSPPPPPNSAQFTPAPPPTQGKLSLVLDYNLEYVLHTILVICGCLWLFVVISRARASLRLNRTLPIFEVGLFFNVCLKISA